MTTSPDDAPDDAAADHSGALLAALADLERHVAPAGWDQAPRLFALVRTDDLVAAEPELADRLGLRATGAGGLPGALTAIEQDDFTPTDDVLGDLAAVEWPSAVAGCALSLVRSFLPAVREDEIPDDDRQAAAYVHEHPDRQDVLLVVGVDRTGAQHGLARVASQPDHLLSADDLVPGVALALAHTLS